MNEILAIMTALTTVLTAGGAGMWKIWEIVKSCNTQLVANAAEADSRRDAAEERNAVLMARIDALVEANESLRCQVLKLEVRVATLTRALALAHTDNENREARIKELESQLDKGAN